MVGGGIDYLRSYHLRVLAVPMGLAAVLGWARWWPATLGFGAVGIGAWGLWTPLAPPEDLVGPTDEVADALSELTPPIWVDRIWWEGEPCLEPSGVVLSAVLAGRPGEEFQLDPAANFVLVECGMDAFQGLSPSPSLQGGGWRARFFEGPMEAANWVEQRGMEPIQQGGAWDWASVLHPETVRLQHADWSAQ